MGTSRGCSDLGGSYVWKIRSNRMSRFEKLDKGLESARNVAKGPELKSGGEADRRLYLER
eukprot:scaffold300131_cov40-Tisochrysis_lutea.AAC.3